MPLSQDDEDFIESGLEALYKSSVASLSVNHDQVREYIDVGEFGLALDLLAHIQLKSGEPPSLDIRELFEALALKMGMEKGDEWQGVANIRAA